MSQLEDINAINAMFVRTKPANATSATLKGNWASWWNGLRPYDKSSSSGTYKEAVARRDAFFKAEDAGPTHAAVSTAPTKPGSTVIAVPPGPRPVIKVGSSGEAVKEWQRVIGVSADGKFGPGTDTATRAWQRARGLTADGVVGAGTWGKAQTESAAAMARPTSVAQAATQAAQQVAASAVKPPAMPALNTRPVLRRGSTGTYVQQWQKIIAVDADGKFGPGTEVATKAWQKARGLTADGVVGANSWNRAQVESGTPLTTAQVVQQTANQIAQGSKPPAAQTPVKPPAAPASAPSVINNAREYVSNATPAAVKETVAAVTTQLATLNASTPVWVKAMGVATAALAGLIGFKVLGSGKRRAA